MAIVLDKSTRNREANNLNTNFAKDEQSKGNLHGEARIQRAARPEPVVVPDWSTNCGGSESAGGVVVGKLQWRGEFGITFGFGCVRPESGW